MKRADFSEYDKNYFLKRCGGGRDFLEGKFLQRFYDAVKLGKVQSTDRILDAGGGRGEIGFIASKLGASTETIDISKDAIEIIKESIKKFCKKRDGKVSCQVMDIQKLKYPDEIFDKIFFLETIEHLFPKEAGKTMKELLRVLKSSGKLIISTTPNKTMIDILIKLSRIFLKENEWKSRRFHVNEQSYDTLKNFLKKFNIKYRIITFEQSNFFYAQIKENDKIGYQIKNVVKIFNWVYDIKIFKAIRSLPFINEFFCHGFLIEVEKR